MRYRIICDKEKEFLEKDGSSLDDIYGGLSYRDLTKEQAQEIAEQLNEWRIAGERYTIERE